MSLESCRGVLLRSHPYSDSSQIFRFLTAERGLVSVIGKGTRSRHGKGGGSLQTFGSGVLTIYFRPDRDLHTLRDFQGGSDSLALGRDLARFLGASLVAELVLAHRLEEADPPLFDWVCETFFRLETVPRSEVPGWILAGGWRTLAHLGYPPETGRCVRCGASLEERHPDTEAPDGETCRFDVVAGGLTCDACGSGTPLPRVGPTARRDLVALVGGAPPPQVKGASAHLGILESFAIRHLDPRREFQSIPPLRVLLNKMAETG